MKCVMMFFLMNIFLMMMNTDSTALATVRVLLKLDNELVMLMIFHDAGTGDFHAGDDNSNGDF